MEPRDDTDMNAEQVIKALADGETVRRTHNETGTVFDYRLKDGEVQCRYEAGPWDSISAVGSLGTPRHTWSILPARTREDVATNPIEGDAACGDVVLEVTDRYVVAGHDDEGRDDPYAWTRDEWAELVRDGCSTVVPADADPDPEWPKWIEFAGISVSEYTGPSNGCLDYKYNVSEPRFFPAETYEYGLENGKPITPAQAAAWLEANGYHDKAREVRQTRAKE